MPPGARYYRADLHTHTPASKDYTDKKTTPKEILDTAEAAGVEILAITDHNSGDWIDRIREAANGSSVHIMPGVEITTPAGHILALFERDTEASKISDLLVALGIERNQHGSQDAISEAVEVVLQKISTAGGLAIAAHANTKKIGLLQRAKGQHAMTLVRMPELAALEFKKNEDVKKFSQGKVANYPKKACTQSSDSHRLEDIGQRTTFLKMHEVSLEGLRQALFDPEVRVRFPWNLKESAHPRIVSLNVDQGFFSGTTFSFHESLNCLVGGKGAGKSTVIELLRYCFDDVSEFDPIQEDHQGKIESLVGAGGAVIVEYLDSDGERKTIRREVNPGEETKRDVRDNGGNPSLIETPPTFFSQGELVYIASSPIAQLDLLDRTLNLAGEDAEESQLVNRLETNAKQLEEWIDKIAELEEELDDPETGKKATEHQHMEFGKKLKDPILQKFSGWETEQKYLSDSKKALEELPDQLTEALADLNLDSFVDSPPRDIPHSTHVAKVKRALEGVEKLIDGLEKKFSDELGKISMVIETVTNDLKPIYQKHKTQYEKTLHDLGEADLRHASTQFRNLGRRLASLKAHVGDLDKAQKKSAKFEASRKRLTTKLKAVRKRRLKKRLVKAREYEIASNGLIRIQVVEGGDRTAFTDALLGLAKGSFVKHGKLAEAAKQIDPSKLVQFVLEEDVAGLVETTNMTETNAGELISHLGEKSRDELYALEVVPLPDQPVILYRIDNEREKPLKELSTGQKGTVIMTLALAEGRGPLVIDHPEEPLDTKAIYGQVVQALRATKDERQFLFTTHNPNIAVSADAELSHILEATADKGTIKISGAIDDPATNALLLVHLEGGSDALTLRMGKYGVSRT